MSIARKILMGAAGAGSKTTYVDDVFSTYLYKGTGANPQSINNGIDMSEGGLVWVKSRVARSHDLYDTVRGTNSVISSDTNGGAGTVGQYINYLNNGFSLTSQNNAQYSGENYSSWTFRKAKGFFDVVTYTGNGSNRTIAHNLGSVPGSIWIKCTSENGRSWTIFHRDVAPVDPASYRLRLDTGDGRQANAGYFNSTEPTSTHFSLGSNSDTNANGQSYVAYVFAGGASTAANARSVYFNGGASLSLADTTDLEPGSGDFTIEAWVRPNADATSYDYLWSNGWGQQISWYQSNSGEMKFRAWFNDAEDSNYNVSLSSSGACAPREAWNHVAVVRNGNTWTLYVNGNAESTVTASFTVSSNSDLPTIGRFDGSGSNSYHMKGSVSNFRFTKGQALYTSNFKPSIEPLTTTSQGAQAGNVKLLCCNGSTPTSSTVTPGTITNNSGVATRINNPFDDLEGYKFGEEGDQNIIKCGSYAGNGATDPYEPIIDLGWEPQWVMIKASDRAAEWSMVDCMRGIVTGATGLNGNDAVLYPSESDAEVASSDIIEVTATGFRLKTSNQLYNQDTKNYIYMAIRRPDGYVGKPAKVGTDVFAMDGTSNGLSVFPQFTSGFPVDFSLTREPNTAGTWYSWHTGARLLQGTYQLTATSNPWAAGGNFQYDYNDGIFLGTWTDYMSWMWKRHAGFDVVCFKGVQNGKLFNHNLGRVPEMMWFKCRTADQDWMCYHKGLNGGVNPEQWSIVLASNYNQTGSAAESNSTVVWNNTAPTAETFSSGGFNSTGHHNGEWYVTMLFASVEGISKVGYYDGTGSSLTITTGFQPRFLILKRVNGAGAWFVLDTVRGWASGNDEFLLLNSTDAQDGNYNIGAPTSTGFQLNGSDLNYNASGNRYIYYAHA